MKDIYNAINLMNLKNSTYVMLKFDKLEKFNVFYIALKSVNFFTFENVLYRLFSIK